MINDIMTNGITCGCTSRFLDKIKFKNDTFRNLVKGAFQWLGDEISEIQEKTELSKVAQNEAICNEIRSTIARLNEHLKIAVEFGALSESDFAEISKYMYAA